MFEIKRGEALTFIESNVNQLPNEMVAQILNLFDGYKNFVVVSDDNIEKDLGLELKVTSINIQQVNNETNN